jgi:hypothetical protein
VLNPGSPQARSIFDLGIVAGIIFAIIFVIVAGIIVFALMRFRWREGEPDPHQLAGNRNDRNRLDGDSVRDRRGAFRAHGPHDELVRSAARAGAGPCRNRPSMVVGGALPKVGRRGGE